MIVAYSLPTAHALGIALCSSSNCYVRHADAPFIRVSFELQFLGVPAPRTTSAAGKRAPLGALKLDEDDDREDNVDVDVGIDVEEDQVSLSWMLPTACQVLHVLR